MESQGGEHVFRCPCFEVHTNTDYQRIMDLKDVGLVIYRQTSQLEDVVNIKADTIKSATDTSKEVFILHNTNDTEILSADIMQSLDFIHLSCPRCRYVFENAKKLLKSISKINRNTILGICDHCRKKLSHSQCQECDEVLKKFVTGREKDKTIKRHMKTWPSKLHSLLKDVIITEKHAMKKSYTFSDVSIENVHQYSPLSLRQPKIGDMFYSETIRAGSTKSLDLSDRGYAKVKKRTTFAQFSEQSITDHSIIPNFFRIPTGKYKSEEMSKTMSDMTLKQPFKTSPRRYAPEYADEGSDLFPKKLEKSKSENDLLLFETGYDYVKEGGFDYHFAKLHFYENEIKAGIKKSVSSSELIKNTQDMLKVRAEKEKLRQEEERQKREEEKEIRRKRSEENLIREEKNTLSEKESDEIAAPNTDDEKKILTERKAKKYGGKEEYIIKEQKSLGKEEKILLGDQESKVKPKSAQKEKDAYTTSSEKEKKKKPTKDDEEPHVKEPIPKIAKEVVEKPKIAKEPMEKHMSAKGEEAKSKISKEVERQKKVKEEGKPILAKDAEKKPKIAKEEKEVGKTPKSVKEEGESSQIAKEVERLTKSNKLVKDEKEIPTIDKVAEKTKKEKPEPVLMEKEPKRTKEVLKDKDKKEVIEKQKESAKKEVEPSQTAKDVERFKKLNKLGKDEKKIPITKVEDKTKKDKPEPVLKEKEAKTSKEDSKDKKEVLEKQKELVNEIAKESDKSKAGGKDAAQDDDFRKLLAQQAKELEEMKKEHKQRELENQKARNAVGKVVKELESNFPIKSATKQQPKPQKTASSSPPPPHEKKQEIPSKDDLNIKQIKVHNPSEDDLILRLIKFKQGAKSDIPPSLMGATEFEPSILLKNKENIVGSMMDTDSSGQLDIEYIAKAKEEENLANIIIGENIFKCKPPMIDKPEQEVLPKLFMTDFKEELSELKIPEAKATREIDPVNQNKPLLTTKEIKGVEQEAFKGIIRYALSDRSFIDKGWTMLPTEKVVRKMNVYRMRPAHPEFDWFEHNKNKRLMQYDTGEKLAEFDDNGRGRWYYKNGRLALDYYDAEEINAQQRYVVYSNGMPDERGRSRPYTILATFDYLGNGVVFDHSGKIRLKYNQTEGVVLDRSIGPVSHWKWHTLNDPPVLQQVMIDTQMSHKDPGILKLGVPGENKPRPDNEEMLAIEFDNFIKEKSKKLTQKFKPFQIKMKALKINECFSLKVLDQATVYLIFRDGSANLKLNMGMILDHKEIVDTDTAEVGEVSSNLERLPARTDSLAGLQASVAHASRVERARLERERRLRPAGPCASADRLAAAASRPLRPPFRTACPPRDYPCRCRKPTSNLYYDTRLI